MSACPACSGTLRESHCELHCPRCGYLEDCSDGMLPQLDGGEKRFPQRSHTPQTAGFDSPPPPPDNPSGRTVTVRPIDASIYPPSAQPRSCRHVYSARGWSGARCIWCNAPEV